jgi:hypothetical protein
MLYFNFFVCFDLTVVATFKSLLKLCLVFPDDSSRALYFPTLVCFFFLLFRQSKFFIKLLSHVFFREGAMAEGGNLLRYSKRFCSKYICNVLRPEA